MSAVNPSISPNLMDLRSGLLARLEGFRIQVRKHLVLEGVARWIAEAVGVALLSFLLDRLLRLSLPTRLVVLAIGAIYLAIEAWRWVITPLRLQFGVISLAAAIDRAGGEDLQKVRGVLAARVASVLELPELLRGPMAPSPAMVRTAVLRCHEALNAVKFENHLNVTRRQASVSAIVAVLTLSLLMAAANHRAAGIWFRRYFLGSNEPWPQKTYLLVHELKNGRIVVPKAEPFVLRVTTEGSVAPETVTLRYREGRGPKMTVAMTRYEAGDFRYDFPPLAVDADVELTGNDDVVPLTIAPIDRPRITDLLLVSQHPTEEKPTPHNFAGQDADLSFLPKTEMTLTFASNVPVSRAILKSNVASPGAEELKQVDDRKFVLAWRHEAAVQLQIELVGRDANLTSSPMAVAIGLKQDLPPRVSLTFSGVRNRVTPQARIPLAIQARDDFGVARLDLITKTDLLDPSRVPTAAATGPSTGPATTATPVPTTVPTAETATTTLVGPVIPPTELEVQHKHELSVAAMKLSPGAILAVSAAAVDNCYLGPQTGLSRVITFRIVPPEELFREILLRQQGERAKFRKQIEESQKLRDALNTTTTPEAALALGRQQRLIQREVSRIANSLSESVIEMKYNGLGGPEAWDLMDKNVLVPLKKLNDGPMTQQKDALDALKGDDAAKIAEASTRQDEIVKTMQEILKQMSQWDSFVDVLNQLNEIIKMETNVHQSTEQMKKKQTEGIFD